MMRWQLLVSWGSEGTMMAKPPMLSTSTKKIVDMEMRVLTGGEEKEW